MKHCYFGIQKSLILFSIAVGIGIAAEAADQQNNPAGGQGARACDTYIAKYCTSGSDHGPGCLKGHESDISADCLKDMQHGGGHGGPGGAHR